MSGWDGQEGQASCVEDSSPEAIDVSTKLYGFIAATLETVVFFTVFFFKFDYFELNCYESTLAADGCTLGFSIDATSDICIAELASLSSSSVSLDMTCYCFLSDTGDTVFGLVCDTLALKI